MNKFFNLVLALTMCMAAVVITSCQWNNPDAPTQQELESKIIGKWKIDVKEGRKYLTNNKLVLTFNDQQECTYSLSREVKPFDGYFWINKAVAPYVIDGNLLSWSNDEDPDYSKLTIAISSISDNMFSYDKRIITHKSGFKIPTRSYHIYKRVTADYSQDIIGLWEGVDMTGYETYGDANHRILYKADGTYVYYSLVDGEWQPLEDVFDEWNVDGDWLATRWQNKGSDVMNYEWWDIVEIKDGVMKWSALREKKNGERFETTFTWKKVKN